MVTILETNLYSTWQKLIGWKTLTTSGLDFLGINAIKVDLREGDIYHCVWHSTLLHIRPCPIFYSSFGRNVPQNHPTLGILKGVICLSAIFTSSLVNFLVNLSFMFVVTLYWITLWKKTIEGHLNLFSLIKCSVLFIKNSFDEILLSSLIGTCVKIFYVHIPFSIPVYFCSFFYFQNDIFCL